MAQTLAPELKKYFWDGAFSDLSFERHAVFIIERILNFGKLATVKWLLGRGDTSFLQHAVAHRRTAQPQNQKLLENDDSEEFHA